LTRIVLGMVTAPPEPVYPVMVIAPLLFVKVNWACATAGNANNNSSGRYVCVFKVIPPLPGRAVGADSFPVHR